MEKLKIIGNGIHIKVKDISKSRKFYEEVLDMIPIFGYGDKEFRKTLPKSIPSILNDGIPGAPEKYCGVTYEPTPSSPIEIANGHIAVQDEHVFLNKLNGPKISAMIRVESLIPLIKNKNIKYPAKYYYWGTIEIVLKDPDDFIVVLIAPYSQEEFDELSKHIKIDKIDFN